MSVHISTHTHTYTYTHTHTHTFTFSTTTDYLWYEVFNDHSTCDTLLHHNRTTYTAQESVKSVGQYYIYNNTRCSTNATHCGVSLHELLYLLHQQHRCEHVALCQLHYCMQCIVLAAKDLDKSRPVQCTINLHKIYMCIQFC